MANQPHSDRWLILIAYLTGLSIGVHLLNLLCLPAIVLVYYYKKTPNATAKGSLLALLGSGVLVAAVLYGIVPGIVKVGGWFELLFVNGLGMSFNSGVVVYIILLAAALIWGVYESYTEKSRLRMAISFILTIALLGIPFYGHGVSSILIGVVVIAIWHLPCSASTGKDQREMAHLRPYHEYGIAVHHDDRDRLFLLCTDRDPFYRQHTDGPELSGRYLHAGRIPRP